MDARIDETLEALGIAHLAERLPTALSGGEQQRVAIAAILCMGPGLLVLDEPTAQLDPAATRAVAELLAGRAAAGTAVLVAEHRAAVLGSTARCLVLDGGIAAGIDVPGAALGPGIGGRAGVAVPAVATLAHALGLTAGRALDSGAVAAAIRAAGPGELAAAASRVRAAGAWSGPDVAVAPWEAVREQAPAGIEIRGLRHAYPGGTEALRGIDLAIAPGEAVAIVGQNGSGKTTLAKHLVRILAPGAGSVLVAGRDLAGRTIADVARTVGFVFQDPDRQLFSRSVEREVAFGPRNLGLAEEATARLVAQALAAVGLADRAEENPYDLGLSDRKLVALASVLAMDPAVLVLDEPTTGQDAPGIARVGAIVDALDRRGPNRRGDHPRHGVRGPPLRADRRDAGRRGRRRRAAGDGPGGRERTPPRLDGARAAASRPAGVTPRDRRPAPRPGDDPGDAVRAGRSVSRARRSGASRGPRGGRWSPGRPPRR